MERNTLLSSARSRQVDLALALGFKDVLRSDYLATVSGVFSILMGSRLEGAVYGLQS